MIAVGLPATLEATLAFELIVEQLLAFELDFGGRTTMPSPADQHQLRAGLLRLLHELRPAYRLRAEAALADYLQRRFPAVFDPACVAGALAAYRRALADTPADGGPSDVVEPVASLDARAAGGGDRPGVERVAAVPRDAARGPLASAADVVALDARVPRLATSAGRRVDPWALNEDQR